MGTLADMVRDLEDIAEERLAKIEELDEESVKLRHTATDLKAELTETSFALYALQDEVARLLKLVNCSSIGELVEKINAKS